ncbi:glycosyl hydrolase, family 18 [Aspergillus heteromorphus CBS 117.55]|uniref:chitinase n=1 Tax=Aspergillus heteromorphus CBS 117.55 TaxID=1448321 RepID=A0A317X5N8_9EURO|nr:glycosyl hydrolase, family 18 [Aspergillus heteromorphus CBS 117.55]PWY92867.1 glycosyl hydrolase, family 18 [Aspergillus heteromorphus CBS 117.55]
MLKHLALGLLGLQSVAAMRFAMYIDEYHTNGLPSTDQTEGISHAIMAFAPSTLFNSDSPAQFTPFEPVSTMRSRFGPNTKVMIAIGGWGDSSGFSQAATDETSRNRYAKNVAAMLDSHGFDGVDIDWEYPGGNGQDYKQTPNSAKVSEITTYPLFLSAMRSAIGPNKTLSIAVPGKLGDMIAFTPETGPQIWPSVDMVNVMTYDLMNRRNNVTMHHTSVKDSLRTIQAYADIGLEGEKTNLGMAYYAKWFETEPGAGCDEQPLGCKTVVMENDDGSDNGKSGALTFEKSTMGAAPKDLKISYDGTCGADKGKCPDGQCCSQYGNCGTTSDFCQAGCLSDYGTCKGISLTDSWRAALSSGKTDTDLGGQYYFDSPNNIFWTWDTADLIGRKFTDIVDESKLGGVMAWSLGEDTLAWEHLGAMQEGVKGRS